MKDGLVGQVLRFSGSYATLPEQAPGHTAIHLLHGKTDNVIPMALVSDWKA